MSCRVYGSDFEDDKIVNKSDYIKDVYFSCYDYMLGFVYAVRLVDLYHQAPNKIFKDFNSVLAGEKNFKTFLAEYHLSLEDNDTIDSFIKMVDFYRETVDMKYGTSVHKGK